MGLHGLCRACSFHYFFSSCSCWATANRTCHACRNTTIHVRHAVTQTRRMSDALLSLLQVIPLKSTASQMTLLLLHSSHTLIHYVASDDMYLRALARKAHISMQS